MRCILAVLLSTVSGAVPLLGTPGWRTDAPPWRSAAPSPQCGTGLPHIPRPCGSLSGIAATSSTDVWAVGAKANPSPDQPLIEPWNGQHWRIVPGAPRTVGTLFAVAALSPTDVWAVGFSQSRPLIEHWDGTRWSRVPDGSRNGYWLVGVAAVSPRDVWAVSEDDHSRPLVEHWDGVRWRVVPTPSVGGGLSGVAAISPHDAWAVGVKVLHWNGLRWREVPYPTTGYVPAAALHGQDPRGVVVGLAAVRAFSAHDIWAVGSYDAVGCCRAGTGPAIVHWDGRSWRRVPSPNIPGSARYNLAGVELTGVSAVSAADVWAVSRIATEHWDGTRWRIVASPHRNPKTIAALSAVAAIAPRDVWAVGGVLNETVAAHWNGVRWGIAPTPNTNV